MIAWEPLGVGLIAVGIAAVLYIVTKGPRYAAVFVAVAIPFLVVGFRPALALAHRPVTSLPMVVIIAVGAAVSLALFVFVVIKGHHKHPMLRGRGRAGGGQGGGSPKAPHHRAMAVTAAAMVFVFLAVAHWSAVAHMGRSGVSQTISGITG